jgi:threonyl-tRNA synthetase
LSTIHLPIDIDVSDRSLGKKIAEARVKKYNHIIVVGGREVESGSMNLQIMNQPNEQATVEALENALGNELNEKERAKNTVNIGLAAARKYFETLANSFL